LQIWAPIKSQHSISLSHACLVLSQLCFLNSVMGGMLLWNLSFVPALFDLLHCEKVGIRLKKEMTESTDRVKRSLKTRERYLFMKASLSSLNDWINLFRLSYACYQFANIDSIWPCLGLYTQLFSSKPPCQNELLLPSIMLFWACPFGQEETRPLSWAALLNNILFFVTHSNQFGWIFISPISLWRQKEKECASCNIPSLRYFCQGLWMTCMPLMLFDK